ncbi:MAG: hypothetical protein AAFN74_21770 [Myxococcota bacterium]
MAQGRQGSGKLLPTLTAQQYGSNKGGGAGRTGPTRPSLRGALPTLTVCGNYNRAGASEKSGDGLATVLGTGQLSPPWIEWFMGFPVGWCDLGDAPSKKLWETPSSLPAPNGADDV